MEFKGPEHIYPCIPPVLGNEKDENPVVIHLKGISHPEKTEYQRKVGRLATEFSQDRYWDEFTRITDQQFREKFVKVENLIVAGKTVESFDEFVTLAPPELVDWARDAITSTSTLTGAERKNS